MLTRKHRFKKRNQKNEIWDHMSEGNVEIKSKIIANIIDTGGGSIA